MKLQARDYEFPNGLTCRSSCMLNWHLNNCARKRPYSTVKTLKISNIEQTCSSFLVQNKRDKSKTYYIFLQEKKKFHIFPETSFRGILSNCALAVLAGCTHNPHRAHMRASTSSAKSVELCEPPRVFQEQAEYGLLWSTSAIVG